MNTQNYIINDINPFEVTSKVSEVQTAFNQLSYSHIPIQKAGVYSGCISETDVHCLDGKNSIEEHLYAIEAFFVRKSTNWLDILEAFAIHNTNIMPVLDSKNNYLGYYELSDIMNLFNHTPFLNEAGGIIVVEKGIHDNSFSEICQIIESNEAKILGLFISKLEI